MIVEYFGGSLYVNIIAIIYKLIISCCFRTCYSCLKICRYILINFNNCNRLKFKCNFTFIKGIYLYII